MTLFANTCSKTTSTWGLTHLGLQNRVVNMPMKSYLSKAAETKSIRHYY